jgi:hypothetical protein
MYTRICEEKGLGRSCAAKAHIAEMALMLTVWWQPGKAEHWAYVAGDNPRLQCS